LTSSDASQAVQSEQWVWLARIRRPQGRKGEVFADILTDFPEKFAERRQLWLLSEQKTDESGPSAEKADPSTSNPNPVKGTGFSPYIKPAKSLRALASDANSPAISPRQVELVAHWLHKGGVVLHFSGVDSISAAETLNGLIVAIPLAERAPLADGEVYIADLIGCTLYDIAGPAPVLVGKIEDVDRTAGPVALLIVRGATDEILIPFAKSYLRTLDLAAKRVEMALPEGLADLNMPGKS